MLSSGTRRNEHHSTGFSDLGCMPSATWDNTIGSRTQFYHPFTVPFLKNKVDLAPTQEKQSRLSPDELPRYPSFRSSD